MYSQIHIFSKKDLNNNTIVDRISKEVNKPCWYAPNLSKVFLALVAEDHEEKNLGNPTTKDTYMNSAQKERDSIIQNISQWKVCQNLKCSLREMTNLCDNCFFIIVNIMRFPLDNKCDTIFLPFFITDLKIQTFIKKKLNIIDVYYIG